MPPDPKSSPTQQPDDLDVLVRDGETINFCTRGDGMTEPTIRAFRLFLRAAEGGHAAAQNYLGLCYLDGDGVQQDYGVALKWFRLAAEQGNPLAQGNLGTCYFDGKGVQKDFAEAAGWYRRSAEQGNARAQTHLGVCYQTGAGVGSSTAPEARRGCLTAAGALPSAHCRAG